MTLTLLKHIDPDPPNGLKRIGNNRRCPASARAPSIGSTFMHIRRKTFSVSILARALATSSHHPPRNNLQDSGNGRRRAGHNEIPAVECNGAPSMSTAAPPTTNTASEASFSQLADEMLLHAHVTLRQKPT